MANPDPDIERSVRWLRRTRRILVAEILLVVAIVAVCFFFLGYGLGSR